MKAVEANEIVWRPTQEQVERANVTRFMKAQGIGSYPELLQRSAREIEWFWQAALEDLGVEWYRRYSTILDAAAGFPWARWFVGGQVNLVHNCLDRHAAGRPSATALIWEGDDGEVRRLSYGELDRQVCALASALADAGIQQGDSIGFYMPMVPELVEAFLAVAKIGAVAVPVFSAFGPDALAIRLQDAGVKLLFTSDGCFRRGKKIPIKQSADSALSATPTVEKVVVLKRTGAEVQWNAQRDVWWEDFVGSRSGPAPTAVLEAEARCLIIYTSGTTGRPKGTVHTHGGVLAQTAKELGYYFDVVAEDRFFWLTDIGWMMGPWEIFGVLFHGAACMIFEGAPDWPKPDRLWKMIAGHRITHLGISPTAVRMLLRAGNEWVEPHDLSSLRILGSTGEPWDPESYGWLFRKVGREQCPVINISGGTEVMGCLVGCAPVYPLKSCSFQGPGLGMDVDVVDEAGNPVRGAVGYLAMRKPAPSMTRGFLNDNERYLSTYFSKWPEIWYHGDWARVDGDGFWYIEGRADDTIKTAGKRMGPAEIEAVLMTHPAVAEAAAIGVPHEIKGEVVVCFVVLRQDFRPGPALTEAISDHVVAALGKTVRPADVHCVEGLPKTRSAKIVRGAIKRRYLGLPPGDLSSVENVGILDSIPAPREEAQGD